MDLYFAFIGEEDTIIWGYVAQLDAGDWSWYSDFEGIR